MPQTRQFNQSCRDSILFYFFYNNEEEQRAAGGFLSGNTVSAQHLTGSSKQEFR